MANNQYGLPPLPPMGLPNGNNQYHHQQYAQQQQSERISGDGEEVHRLGYLRQPPQGPPQFLPQIGLPPPPQATPGIPYNYESFNQIPLTGNTQYDQYDYGNPPPIQLPGLQQNGVLEEAYPTVDNRSIDGEEQHLQRYGNNDPMVPMQGMGVPPPVPLMSLSSTSILNPIQPPPLNVMSTSSTTPMESHQPVGVEMPQQFQTVQQEQRSETIGSSEADTLAPPSLSGPPPEEDFREIGGDFLSLGQQSDNDPRSIEGQEYPDPESIGSNGTSAFTASTHPPLTVLPLSQEHRSQTIGSETQVEEDSRSIEGQEQVANDFNVGAQGHVPPLPQASLQSSYQRSETLGSDTVYDEPRGGPTKSKHKASKPLNPPSGSETGESVSRNTRDHDDRRRRKEEYETPSNKSRRHDEVRRTRRHRSPSLEEDDDSYEGDRSAFDRRSEKDYRRESSRKVKSRDKDRQHRHRQHNDSRQENLDWEQGSARGSSRHGHDSLYYDRDREDNRPRSRNSTYYRERDYYPGGSRHRREDYDNYDNSKHRDDFYNRSRGPPSRYEDPSNYYLSGTNRNHYGRMPPHIPPIAPAPVLDPREHSKMYLDKLRLENPGIYREWYLKYQKHIQDRTFPMPPIPGYQPLPVFQSTPMPKRDTHSGRSSVAEITSHPDSSFRPIKTEAREPSPPKRTTPQKFSTSHSFAFLTPLGQLVRVRNGSTVVELQSVKSLMKKLPEYKEVKAFPGPLIKDVTHKNTIVQFCQRKIRELEFNDAQVDRDNLILLWEFLILLLKQNGMAIGSDVAELLLKSKSTGRELDRDSDRESSEDEANTSGLSVNPFDKRDEEKHIAKFCELLLFGHKKEALDFAMDNGLWGHALFFASKMDEKTYANVLVRFANGIALNSPLQTLYQVLNGKPLVSLTLACEDSFGDWKPHLAMILSNAGLRPEVAGKAIITLGDTLRKGNHPFAAQFCYLMSDGEFASDSNLGPLLGFIPSVNNIIEATQMTEIYEFARSLGNPNHTLGTPFIERKLNYTRTLLDIGFVPEAYLYCEELTKSLGKARIGQSERCAAWNILRIAERLVNCDDSNSVEPAWLVDLRNMTEHVGSESASRKLSLATTSSDVAGDIPPSSSQVNQYPLDNNNPVNHYSTATPYTETQFSSNQDGYVSEQNQWNQPPMSLPDETNTPLNYVPPNTHQYNYPNNNVQPNGPSNMSYDTSSSAPITNSNNNYVYSNYGSIPSYTGNPEAKESVAPPNDSYSGKKKTVRFEDEEMIANIVNVLEPKQVGGLKNRMKHDIITSSLQSSRSDYNSNYDDELSQLHRSSGSVKGFNEGESKSDHSFDDRSPASSPIKFKSTFPIDEPIGQSLAFKSKIDQRKAHTFPIDERCCDPNQPCEEHDNYYNEKDGSNASFENLVDNLEPDETEETQYGAQMRSSKPSSGDNKRQNKEKQQDKSNSLGKQQQKGWFNTLFTKLIPNVGNQAHLPDDKTPSIIWDDAKKAWVNANGEDDDDSGPRGPPPSDADLMGGMGKRGSVGPQSNMPPMQNNVPMGNPANPQFTNPMSNGLPPNHAPNNMSQPPGLNGNGAIVNNAMPPPGGNMENKYKRPKGISMRNNYVDIFNPGGTPRKPEESTMPSPSMIVPPTTGPGMPNIFIPNPAPVTSDSGPTSFLSSAAPEPYPNSNERNEGPAPTPQMFDPSQFQNQRNDYDYSLTR